MGCFYWFSAHSLQSLAGGCTPAVTEEGVDILLEDISVEPEAYTSWKEALSSAAVPVPPPAVLLSPSMNDLQDIIARIRAFDLANQTLMECALFLSAMQKEIRRIRN